MKPMDSGLSSVVTGRRRTAQKVSLRRARLLEQLQSVSWTSVERIIADLGVSEATIRRDLRCLEAKGVIRRDYGAVRLADPPTFAPYLDDPGFREQVHHMAEEKRRIGRVAAGLIEDGETVAIAPGTTTAQVAQALHDKRDLTVVTNAVNIVMELSRRKDFRIHVTGGRLSGDWFALVGPGALRSIRTVFPDKFFFGANGVHWEHGVTDRHGEEAAANLAMARRARQRILVADHTKLGQVASCLVCPIQEVSIIVTDAVAAGEMIAPFEASGIQVLRA